MGVSHETIDRYIYAQPRGERRKTLIGALRQAHERRLPRSRGGIGAGGSRRGSRSTSAPPRCWDGKCPATGQAISSRAQAMRAPWGPGWSATAASSCSPRCRGAMPRRCSRASPGGCGHGPLRCARPSPMTRAVRWPATRGSLGASASTSTSPPSWPLATTHPRPAPSVPAQRHGSVGHLPAATDPDRLHLAHPTKKMPRIPHTTGGHGTTNRSVKLLRCTSKLKPPCYS